MSADPGTHDNDKELVRMWQEMSLPSGPFDESALARQLAERVEKFDRRIYWRNFREYAAGVLTLAWFGWVASVSPERRPVMLLGIAAVLFVMTYLWRSSRGLSKLDPSADARSYQRVMLERYDLQIRLLRKVKYWYVLPLYLWMLAVVVTLPSRLPGGRLGAFLVFTLFALFVAWLNESYGVKKLRQARIEAEALLRRTEE